MPSYLNDSLVNTWDTHVQPHYAKVNNTFPEVFTSLDYSTLYLGIELEYGFDWTGIPEVSRSHFKANTRTLTRWFNANDVKAILVHDGTISRNADMDGVEIVTVPYTYSNLIHLFMNFWHDNAFLLTHPMVGMHVHLSRRAFRCQMDIYKFILFINKEDNRQFIEWISGRPNNTYALLEDKHSARQLISRPANRYQAVNVENDATIEVRIFKSPVDYNEFYNSISFLHNLFRFVVSANFAELHWTNFRTFCNRAYDSAFQTYINSYTGE
jgi:hypothetical protein